MVKLNGMHIGAGRIISISIMLYFQPSKIKVVLVITTEKDVEKKVKEVMEDMLGEQAAAISDVSEKLVQMEGLIYDLRTG